MFDIKKIILIGYRCTGKTSLGGILAARLGLPFADTDDLIQERAGKTVAELVAEGGWPLFRKLEKEVIGSLTVWEKSVISTGGGAVMDEENARLLKGEGTVIWLFADEETIRRRMAGDGAAAGQRPSLSGDDPLKGIEETLALRTPVYRRLADFALDTSGGSLDELADKIMGYLKIKQGGNHTGG